MTMMVQASTDRAPELLDLIEHRRANGLDTFDEWWEGVYRVVIGPSPEHGELIVRLVILLHAAAESEGLRVGTPVNIDIDKVDEIDFGTGSDGYKREWMEKVRPRYRLDLFWPNHIANWPLIARASLRQMRRNAA